MRLHLGCGQQYLEGYVNVDYPPAEHSVQKSLRADLYQDLSNLSYPPSSIEEVRLHHVFEHFPRPVALALLCRWRDWLVPGGTIHIETPDLMASARLLVLPWIGYAKKQEVVRHLFGSHEARWAIHYDGWYPERFARTLPALGFGKVSVRTAKWMRLRNVEVFAVKGPEVFGLAEYRKAAEHLLSLSTIKGQKSYDSPRPEPGSEAQMLGVWMDMWEQAYLAPATP